jgi:hypothetical protein
VLIPEDVANTLEKLNPLEEVKDRTRWATVCAQVILQSQPREVVRAIVAGGLLTFIGVAKPVYSGHCFKHQDYELIFEQLQHAVASWGPVAP